MGKWSGEEDRPAFGEDMPLRMVWRDGRKGEKEKREGKMWNPGKQNASETAFGRRRDYEKE